MYELGEDEEEQEEGYEDADGGEAQEEASGSGLQMALLGSFGTSGQCVFDIVCATDGEILADESTEVHDLGPDLKSDCMSEKTHESSVDHDFGFYDFGFSYHGMSSVCLGEATRGIGGASDVVFQNGFFGLFFIAMGHQQHPVGGAKKRGQFAKVRTILFCFVPPQKVFVKYISPRLPLGSNGR